MDSKVDILAIAEEDVDRFLFCAESRTETPPPTPAGLKTTKHRRASRRGPISSKAGPWRRKMLKQGVNSKMTVQEGLSRIKTLVPYTGEQPAASAAEMSELEIIHSATRYITELESQLLKLRTAKTGARRGRHGSGSPTKHLTPATTKGLPHKIATPSPSPFKKTERSPKERGDTPKKDKIKINPGFPVQNYFNVPGMEDYKPGEDKMIKESLAGLVSLDSGVDSCSSSDSASSALVGVDTADLDCGQLLRETDVLLFPDSFFTQLNELLPKDLNTTSDGIESPVDAPFQVQGEEEERPEDGSFQDGVRL